jgi:hypothetical protein
MLKTTDLDIGMTGKKCPKVKFVGHFALKNIIFYYFCKPKKTKKYIYHCYAGKIRSDKRTVLGDRTTNERT